ncbi:hypothetical protein C8R47DRAFT_1142011 [Mycena vitilis]|nr:hypothetical protein C8R47DRAFT_1142011 [Mycena vitilis]
MGVVHCLSPARLLHMLAMLVASIPRSVDIFTRECSLGAMWPYLSKHDALAARPSSIVLPAVSGPVVDSYPWPGLVHIVSRCTPTL